MSLVPQFACPLYLSSHVPCTSVPMFLVPQFPGPLYISSRVPCTSFPQVPCTSVPMSLHVSSQVPCSSVGRSLLRQFSGPLDFNSQVCLIVNSQVPWSSDPLASDSRSFQIPIRTLGYPTRKLCAHLRTLGVPQNLASVTLRVPFGPDDQLSNLENRSSEFISPSDRVARLYPRHRVLICSSFTNHMNPWWDYSYPVTTRVSKCLKKVSYVVTLTFCNNLKGHSTENLSIWVFLNKFCIHNVCNLTIILQSGLLYSNG